MAPRVRRVRTVHGLRLGDPAPRRCDPRRHRDRRGPLRHRRLVRPGGRGTRGRSGGGASRDRRHRRGRALPSSLRPLRPAAAGRRPHFRPDGGARRSAAVAVHDRRVGGSSRETGCGSSTATKRLSRASISSPRRATRPGTSPWSSTLARAGWCWALSARSALRRSSRANRRHPTCTTSHGGMPPANHSRGCAGSARRPST